MLPSFMYSWNASYGDLLRLCHALCSVVCSLRSHQADIAAAIPQPSGDDVCRLAADQLTTVDQGHAVCKNPTI